MTSPINNQYLTPPSAPRISPISCPKSQKKIHQKINHKPLFLSSSKENSKLENEKKIKEFYESKESEDNDEVDPYFSHLDTVKDLLEIGFFNIPKSDSISKNNKKNEPSKIIDVPATNPTSYALCLNKKIFYSGLSIATVIPPLKPEDEKKYNEQPKKPNLNTPKKLDYSELQRKLNILHKSQIEKEKIEYKKNKEVISRKKDNKLMAIKITTIIVMVMFAVIIPAGPVLLGLLGISLLFGLCMYFLHKYTTPPISIILKKSSIHSNENKNFSEVNKQRLISLQLYYKFRLKNMINIFKFY